MQQKIIENTFLTMTYKAVVDKKQPTLYVF